MRSVAADNVTRSDSDRMGTRAHRSHVLAILAAGLSSLSKVSSTRVISACILNEDIRGCRASAPRRIKNSRRGVPYANMLAPPVSTASISA